ncbi:hypothetical protein K493DRAFT_27166 [Basidiobolus meristosporus CBS 931.73]|uniref:Cyclin N-terminal domain-containing protein n=1 Tax=Basidiobolus meristosporus CBS 931.73 TaxID=1314790 RepID=A0A1Y1Z753_9FUNG|nr:hypothetical protein K493DRAFT_27166 [Basidiobolus meristosporus CBS 931.73]|eukprot:ORY06090.1 hypothetical protein K493DRAFT_27166 [Basidiobolus meristosporus CBS 931.73]
MHYIGVADGELESLVDTVEYVIDRVWHPFGAVSRTKRLIFRGFVREIVKTSRVLHSTVMISLYYLYRIRRIIENNVFGRQHELHGDDCLVEMGLAAPLFGEERFDELATLETDSSDRLYFAKNTFLGALIVAAKYHQEISALNMDWARYTNSTLSQVNDLELEFLCCIQYRLHVSKEQYEFWCAELLTEVQRALTVPQSKGKGHGRPTGKLKSVDRNICHTSKQYPTRLRIDSWKLGNCSSIYDFPILVGAINSKNDVWPLQRLY